MPAEKSNQGGTAGPGRAKTAAHEAPPRPWESGCAMNFSRKLSILVAFALAVPLVVARRDQSVAAGGQQEGQQDREVVAEAPPQQAPLPIPAAEVADRAEQDSVRLQDLRGRLAPDPAVLAIETQLPEAIRKIRRLARESENQIGPEVSVQFLGEIESRCGQAKKQLAEWREELTQRAIVLDEAIAELEGMRGRWQETSKSAKEAGFPPALIDRVRSTLGEILDTEKRVRDRRGAILTLEDQVSQGQVKIAQILAQVQAAHADRRRRLFVIDSPALWRALLEPSPAEQSLRSQIAASWTKSGAALGDFFRAYPERLALQALLFVAAVVLLYRLRVRARQWALKDESLEPSARILDRPLSVALLITSSVTVWLYPAVPRVVYSLTMLLLVVPVLRLLPGVLLTNLRAPLFALATFYVIDQFSFLAPELSLLRRLFVFGETVLVCMGLLWMFRLARLAEDRQGLWWPRSVNWGARVALPILIISGVANLFGNISLPLFLTSVTLRSAYLAVVLYAGALILDGVVAVGLRARLAQSLPVLRDHQSLLRERGVKAVHGAMIILWVFLTLEAAAIREPLFTGVWRVLTATWPLGSMRVSLGDLLAFGLVIWVSFLTSRFVRFVLSEQVFPRFPMPRGMPNAISSMVHYTILLLGFFVAIAAAGLDLGRFALVAGAIGVGIGFGLQNIVNNFISGLILLFERPIQIGDTIGIGSLMGEVRRIGIRSSTLRTGEGAEVIVPNASLVADQVVNWTLSDRHRRVELRIGVCYGSDPQRVIQILLEVARAHPETLENPAPVAFFDGFGESSLNFSLGVWTGRFETWSSVRSDLNVAAYAALRAAGIEIPFPQRDLHLRSVDQSVYGMIGKAKED